MSDILEPFAVALVFLVAAIAAALGGLTLRRLLPVDHLNSDSRDVLRLVLGLVSTLSAMVLGLLIAGAQASYNVQAGALQKMAANVIELDRFLAFYGPQAEAPRRQVRAVMGELHDRVWLSGSVSREAIATDRRSDFTRFYTTLANLPAGNDAERYARSRAMQLADEINLARVLLYEQSGGILSRPFLVVLVFWICVLFLGFSLIARSHATLAAVFLVGAISVASAVYLILELNDPYRGIIQLSDAPVRDAIGRLAR